MDITGLAFGSIALIGQLAGACLSAYGLLIHRGRCYSFSFPCHDPDDHLVVVGQDVGSTRGAESFWCFWCFWPLRWRITGRCGCEYWRRGLSFGSSDFGKNFQNPVGCRIFAELLWDLPVAYNNIISIVNIEQYPTENFRHNLRHNLRS